MFGLEALETLAQPLPPPRSGPPSITTRVGSPAVCESTIRTLFTLMTLTSPLIAIGFDTATQPHLERSLRGDRPMAAYLFHGGMFLDPRKADLQEGIEVLIEDDRIKEVSDRPIGAASAIGASLHRPLRGRTLMPGLIDAHIHIFLAEVNLALL